MFNQKLLALILLPPGMSVFFQLMAKGAFIGFSLSLMYAMIGCFLTSYLIIEEKRIESLKNILITPLKPSELALGKTSFPILICFIFSFLAFALAGKLSMLFEPALLIAVLLMSVVVCLLGLYLGLFVKNEQELGIAGPVFILMFMLGTINAKTSGLNSAGFFPEFHLVHLVDNYTVLSMQQIYLHLAFLVAEVATVLFALTVYLRFFFSSDADSMRINLQSVLALVPLILYIVASGTTSKQFRIATAGAGNLASVHSLKVRATEIVLRYDTHKWELMRLKNDDMDSVQLKSLDNITMILSASVRQLQNDELTEEKRNEKANLYNTVYLHREVSTGDAAGFERQVVVTNTEYRTVYKRICGEQIILLGFQHPFIAKEYAAYNAELLKLIKSAKTICPES